MTTDSSPQATRILSRRTELIFLVVYCICYSVTSLSHVVDVVNNGLTLSTTGPVPGTTVPMVWGVLSKAFTLLNPLTLVLLLVRRQAGIALMVGVTASTQPAVGEQAPEVQPPLPSYAASDKTAADR